MEHITDLDNEQVKKLNKVIAKRLAIRITTAVVVYVGAEIGFRLIAAKLEENHQKKHILN